jgi:hypothetical protein
MAFNRFGRLAASLKPPALSEAYDVEQTNTKGQGSLFCCGEHNGTS